MPTGGVARYARELALALAEQFPEDEYWLLSDQPFSAPEAGPPNLRVGAAPRSGLARRWWLYGLNQEMARCKIDLFHGTDFSVPYWHRRPAVMTLHDLSPWMDPAWQPTAGRIRSRTPRLLRLGLADRIITPSQAVRKEVIDYFRLDPERVIAIPLAARRDFCPAEPDRPGKPYFVFVGTLEPRKNVARLIDAWREVYRSHGVELRLVGRVRDDFAAPAPEPGLLLMGVVADADLPGLYSGALASIYPSMYEGFGLPVLEALQCGALVVTSRDPAITEVARGAAIQVEASDTSALSQALVAIARDPASFAATREAGLRRAAQFSWRETARQTREVYVAAARAVSLP